MNREQELLQEIQKILPAGASVEAELQKFPGHTKTQKMIALLTLHNEERLTGQTLEGYFTGAFESKGHYYWRLTLTNGTAALLTVDNTQLKPPEFGQKIKIENVDKIHYKVSDRDSFSLSYDAKYVILEGHVIDVSPDINDAVEGYGLMLSSLYRAELVGDGKGGKKPIVDERSFNLKITVRGEDGPNRRYASGFINDIENLIALVPSGDQEEIRKLIEQDDDPAVIDALSAYCYNTNFQFKGASILLYGNLKAQQGRDKTFWNVGIMKLFNVDNLGVEIHRIVKDPELQEVAPVEEKATKEELESAFTDIAVNMEDKKAEEKKDEAVAPGTEGEEFKNTSVIDVEIRQTIMDSLKKEPCKAMPLVTKMIEETQASRQEVVENLNELYAKGYIVTKDRKYQVAKEL